MYYFSRIFILQISFEKIKSSKNVIAYNFVATRNTWSHQRRKRREKQVISKVLDENQKMDVSTFQQNSDQIAKSCSCNRATTPDVENALNKLAEVRMTSPVGAKRELEEDDCVEYYQYKKMKTEIGDCKCHHNEFYLKALLVLRNVNDEVSVELSWIEGTENRELLHQIMQYIKNNLKLSAH